MRIFVLLFLCGLLCLFGCASPRRDVGTAEGAFSFASRPFAASLRGVYTRTSPDGYTGEMARAGESRTNIAIPIAATLTYDPTATPATLSVSFTDPPALSGMTVTRTTSPGAAPVVTWTRETATGTADSGIPAVTLTGDSYAPLLRFADALLPTGDITAVSPTENGTYTVTRTSGEGSGVSTVYTFVEDRTLPAVVERRAPGEVFRLTVDEEVGGSDRR